MGKGSRRRKTVIDQETFQENWDKIFGVDKDRYHEETISDVRKEVPGEEIRQDTPCEWADSGKPT